MTESAAEKRKNLTNRLFPNGIPKLWSPPLTHYAEKGKIDFSRIQAHITHVSKYVKAFLIPGSTGDGWEMNDDQIRQLLDFDIELAEKLHAKILIGVLRTDADAVLQTISDTLDWLREKTGFTSNDRIFEKTPVCGFTICPPKGPDLPQQQIYNDLVSILQLDVPIALYQLPQVTENEMSPEIVAKLAEQFGNFYLLKDTSGNDTVALSGLELNDVFLVRGAEGNYSKWLKIAGGSYDGFLLGSTNCFARQLSLIIEKLSTGDTEAAKDLSQRITGVINNMFEAVAGISGGNAFSNAYKAIDHFFAHGPDAVNITPPLIYNGDRLPAELIKSTADLLKQFSLMPKKPYL
jgi:dihydrodipicolinate synthase/N-acetylneuraminate lyase